MLNATDMYGMHEITETEDSFVRKIRKALNRSGKKVQCVDCNDVWFKKDMVKIKGEMFCPICASMR